MQTQKSIIINYLDCIKLIITICTLYNLYYVKLLMNYCPERFLNWVRIYDFWLQIETFWTAKSSIDRYSYQKKIPENILLFVNTKNKRGVKCHCMQNLSRYSSTNTPWKCKMISYSYSELKRQVHSLYLNA